MDRPNDRDAVPDFARPLSTQIERRTEELANQLRRTAGAEASVFGDFESFLVLALANYRPAQPRHRGVGRLVFQPLYDEGLAAPALAHPAEDTPARRHDPCPALLAALMAAEVEALGPLRLTRNQTKRLAGILERIGGALDEEGLLIHAGEAYDRAARLYLDNEDHAARDRCLRRQAAVRHRAMPRGWRRTVQSLNSALFGYGFAPYRLLLWMGAQLVVASVILVLLPKTADSKLGVENTLYVSLQDFVNPMGLGDTQGMSHWAWTVLTLESYLGLLSSSVFFALLLRKWFRA